jgi:hypothetical protein
MHNTEDAMRLMLTIFAALAAISVAGVTSSDAQSKGPKPWCIANGAFGAGSMDCTYWTLEQCLATSRGAGGVCRENPVLLWQQRGWTERQPRNDRRW